VVYNAHLEVFCGLLARIAQLSDIFADARRQADAGRPHQAILGAPRWERRSCQAADKHTRQLQPAASKQAQLGSGVFGGWRPLSALSLLAICADNPTLPLLPLPLPRQAT
jgi:anti-sigma factor RsiW